MNPGFPHAYLFKKVSEGTRIQKRKAGKCQHYGCANEARSKGADCETCKARKRRLKNPLHYAFETVRSSARKRKIAFLLSFQEFEKFCRETDYLNRKGRELESLTIDRIDPALPYQFNNIRALTWRENCFHLVEGMTNPAEPIARVIAKFANGNEEVFRTYLREAEKILEQVEILQRGIAETQRQAENDPNPF